jgi:hypothetical protein
MRRLPVLIRLVPKLLPGVLALFGLSVAAPASALPRFVAPGGADAANLCLLPITPCATIQHAVDVALPGDSIEIAAATYNQRIRIDGKALLTLDAVGVTLRPDPAVLGPADVAQGSPCSGGVGRSVVFVRNSTGIVLNGLRVDGSAILAAPSEPARLVGIFFRNASGILRGGGVTHLRTEPASSNQVAGLGIVVQTDGATLLPPRVDITGVTVSDYQKSGIVFSGCDCAADTGPTGSVRASTVTANPSGLVARNGIQVSFGAAGVFVENNVVSDQRFTNGPALGLGSAILLASSRGDHVNGNILRNANFGISNIGDSFCSPRSGENLGNEIRCNQIQGNDYGLTLDNNTSTVRDNAFSGNTPFGALARDYYPANQGDANVTLNWWGSPTGPTIASNPGGTGDPVSDRLTYAPFRTVPPICAQQAGLPVDIPTLSSVGFALMALLLGAAAVLRLRPVQVGDRN